MIWVEKLDVEMNLVVDDVIQMWVVDDIDDVSEQDYDYDDDDENEDVEQEEVEEEKQEQLRIEKYLFIFQKNNRFYLPALAAAAASATVCCVVAVKVGKTFGVWFGG